jgi:RimJ/RimL family protein N-acetyltransferase
LEEWLMSKKELSALYEFNERYLCPMEKEYLPLLKKWRNLQIDILRQFRPLTDADQEKWFETLQNDSKQVLFAILTVDRTSKQQKFIGYCGLTNIDLKNHIGEISFLVNPDRTENEKLYREDFISVLTMLSRYGFGELGLNKLFTETFSFRKAHIKILDAFGFKRDGVLRQHHFAHGQYFDSIIHSLLVSEWVQVEKTKQ